MGFILVSEFITASILIDHRYYNIWFDIDTDHHHEHIKTSFQNRGDDHWPETNILENAALLRLDPHRPTPRRSYLTSYFIDILIATNRPV